MTDTRPLAPGQMAASDRRERRAHQRKSPRGRCIAKLFRGTLGLGPNLALELLDISLSGARLRIVENLRPGEQVTLYLLGQGHLRPVKVLGHVVWCRPDDPVYICGLTFEKFLAYADFLHIT